MTKLGPLLAKDWVCDQDPSRPSLRTLSWDVGVMKHAPLKWYSWVLMGGRRERRGLFASQQSVLTSEEFHIPADLPLQWGAVPFEFVEKGFKRFLIGLCVVILSLLLVKPNGAYVPGIMLQLLSKWGKICVDGWRKLTIKHAVREIPEECQAVNACPLHLSSKT